jgi:hypothetical protein
MDRTNARIVFFFFFHFLDNLFLVLKGLFGSRLFKKPPAKISVSAFVSGP